MTVSPRRPQDGNHQPSVGGNGVRSDEALHSQALPPTLFRLPNLNPEAPIPEVSVHAFSDQPLARQAPVDHLTSQPIVPATQHSEDDLGPKQAPSPTPGAAPVPPVSTKSDLNTHTPECSYSPEPIVAPRDVPMGRTWMDRIGSHSVVVVLLLVVVAAGLVIGRNSRNQGIDSSLADSNDMLDFDEQTELELPLAKHVHEPQTAIAIAEPTAAESSAVVQNLDATRFEDFESTFDVTDAISNSTFPTSPAAEFVAVGQDVATDALADSATLLQHPLTNLASNGHPNERIAVNQTMEDSISVDVTPASTRIPSESSTSTLPTLDDLNEQSEVAGESATPAEMTPSPRLSNTPAPVIDWRLYLPREQSVSADTDVPTTSN